MDEGMFARALKLCAGSAAVRAMGYGMRIWLARSVSGQALGIYQMCAQVCMLALTPLVSGLPQAASRLTAQRLAAGDHTGAAQLSRAARTMAALGAGAICASGLALVPLLSQLMGSAAMAGALALMLPSVLPLACSAVEHSLMYAQGSTLPAMLQLAEQSVRLLATAGLLFALGGQGAALDAALLASAQAIGAVAALALARVAQPDAPPSPLPSRAIYAQLWRVAWPISLGRMGAAGLRGANQLMLPSLLARSGLSAQAALSEYGVLSGMVLPTIFLPHMFTGPLSTLALPRVAAARGRAVARLCLRALALSCAAGLAAGLALWCAGPLVGAYAFGSVRAGELMRFMAPLAPLGCTSQTLGALLQGLKRERSAMRASLLSAITCTVLTWLLCARPGLGVRGLGVAMMCGHIAQLAMQSAALFRALRCTCPNR